MLVQAAAPLQITEELLRTLKVTWDKQGSNGYGVEHLRELFSKYGGVEDVVLKNKKKSKGSALVIMHTLDGARAASEAVIGTAPNPLLVVPLAKAAGPAFIGVSRNLDAKPQAYAPEQPMHSQQHATSEAGDARQQQDGMREKYDDRQAQHDDSQAQHIQQRTQHVEQPAQHDDAHAQHPGQQAQHGHSDAPTDGSIPPITPPSSPMQKAPAKNPFGGSFNSSQAQRPLFNGFSSFPSAAPARPLFAAGVMGGSFNRQHTAGPAFGAGSYSSFPGMSAVGGQAQASMQDAFGHVHAGAKR